MTSRYSRQERFSPLGEQGQENLKKASVLLCGCGALGSTIAERLTRAGVGRLRIVDRDWVELSNLQRQALFTEDDAAKSRPKAAAAAEALYKINSSIEIQPLVEDITYENIETLAERCDLLIDGTDNFETRFLINDYCVKNSIPWVHGGCLGASGQVLSILPGETACFRCFLPDLPSRDTLESCDTAGVLGPAVGLIACWQSAEALKILSGNPQAAGRGLILLDSWDTETRVVKLHRQGNCKTCQKRDFEFLDGTIRSESTVLCGKNAVQIDSPSMAETSLSQLAMQLGPLGKVTANAFYVRLSLPKHQLTIFRGGRTIVEGTTEIPEARSLLIQILGG